MPRRSRFFSTNDSVLTALKASFTGMFGLHESTQDARRHEGGHVEEPRDACRRLATKSAKPPCAAGYGPTIRADAVKKLVDSVVNFQERSTEIIAEMRKLATQNSSRNPRCGRRRQEAHGAR